MNENNYWWRYATWEFKGGSNPPIPIVERMKQVRKIKFRAWHLHENKMYDVYNLDILFGRYWSEERRECLFSCDIELMQYTGLKDKNGKEIYEGDIVIVTCYSYEQIESESTGEVVYSEALACFALSDGENGFATLSDLQGPFRTEYEVIGNIYDNPDLLGV